MVLYNHEIFLLKEKNNVNPLSCLLGKISTTVKVNIVLGVVVVLLIICSAFFSSCETAFSTVNNIRLRNYADEKRKGARKAVYICENFDKTLSTILVGNNLVNIACTTICAYIFSTLFTSPTLANVMNTVIMTIVILIFGEIMPKAMAKQKPEKFALRFSGTLYIIMKVLYPITIIFNKLQKAFVKNGDQLSPTVTEDELESIIDTMEEEGVIDSENADLIQGVLDLGDTTAYDIMTPRVDVVALPLDVEQDEIKKIFVDTQYSRIPIYSNDIDHIVGILSQKDYFTAIIKNQKIDVAKLMTDVLYINENMKVDDIIREMQKVKKHMAVVIDEHGGTSGIVTFEDAIEEMVGEVYDEHDQEEDIKEEIKQLDEKTYLVDAEVSIEQLFEKLGIEHLPETQYSSIGGFLYELSGNLPSQDQTLEFITVDEMLDKDANYIRKTVKMLFKLVNVCDNRIREVLLTIEDANLEEEN